MASVTRASGITVETTGSATLATATPARGKRSVRDRAAPSGPPPEDTALVAEMARHDLELVDAIPLSRAPTAPTKRRAAAPPARVSLDVPLGPNEQAVVLVEDEGEYRWIVDGESLGSAAPGAKRSVRGPRRQVRFSIDLTPAPASKRKAAPSKVKRGWLKDKVIGKAVAYVFRFVVQVAGKHVIKHLERSVSEGLIAIADADASRWQTLAEDQAPPFKLPKDRAPRVLLFVHGTFSSTLGSFGALSLTEAGRSFLAGALQSYDAVLGYDHRTLSVDPQENAQAILARLRRIAWPQPPEIEMVAYSRGGLVARSLAEQLLPASGWPAKLGRVVFVGCTNGGTALAEPENWHRFADHYTNLALAANRALSFIPGAQGWTAIAGQAIRGVGALVKALASGAISDAVAPGLAAMEPDGAFVKAINGTQPGQVTAAAAKFYAITSNFEAGTALRDGAAPEVPPKLLMRIADWGADEVYREDNDLVVHVRAMTEIDGAGAKFVKDRLEYGTNGVVYHTNYFNQSATANKLSTWFDLAAAGAPQTKRGKARAPVKKVSTGPVSPAFERERVAAERRIEAFMSTPVKAAETKARPAKAAKRSKSAAGKKKGGGGGGGRGGAVSKASAVRTKRAAKKQVKKAVRRMGMKPPSPGSLKGSEKQTRAEPTRAKRSPAPNPMAPPIRRLPDAGGGGYGGGYAMVKRKARGSAPPKPAMAPRVPAKATSSKKGKSSAKRKTPAAAVECHFRAEMPPELKLKQTVSVDVTVSREAIAATPGMATAAAAADVDPTQKLIVEVVPLRNLKNKGARRMEIEVPEADTPARVSFDVTAVAAGEGELSVQVRQGSIPLATMELKPRIVAKPSSAARTLVASAEVAEFPTAEEPLDELRIIEQQVGTSVSYLFMLDLHSLGVREEFESQPLPGARDEYITKILNEIGDSWSGEGPAGVESFERSLRAIGGQMFDQLLPRAMQELLWARRKDIRSVQVFSREPFIPWELVYLKDPTKRVAPEGNPFLGELGLLRWIYKGYPPMQLRVRKSKVRYVAPEYGADLYLEQSAKERELLKKLFTATQVKSKLNDIERLLEKPDAFDLLHFCGHGEAAGTESSQARLLIDGRMDGDRFVGDALKATTVEQSAQLGGKMRPIVVLNACESARRNREFAGMGGFADAFVKAGAGAFVGTHWSVGDAPAFAFIDAFYHGLLKSASKKLTLAKVVQQARLAARGKQDATWLAYVVYGHPHAIVTVE